MNRMRSAYSVLLLCVIVMFGGVGVRAQDLQVSPLGWNFGNVPVGTSSTMTFDLLSGWPSPVWVYVVFLSETPDDDGPIVTPYEGGWSLGAFSFNPATWPMMPQEVPVGNHVLIDLIFTPPEPGGFHAYLGIWSNDSVGLPGPQAHYLLEGTGVSASVAEPATLALVGLGLAGLGFSRRKRQSLPDRHGPRFGGACRLRMQRRRSLRQRLCGHPDGQERPADAGNGIGTARNGHAACRLAGAVIGGSSLTPCSGTS
jgi:hypothetical protein